MEALRIVELSKKTHDKLLLEVAKENNLTLNELKILVFLSSNNKNNIAKNIVEGLGCAKSHISTSLYNLEQNGYIVKIPDEKDKKKSHLNLTNKSLTIIKKSKGVQKKLRTIMFKDISKEEVSVLSNVFEKILENLELYNKN